MKFTTVKPFVKWAGGKSQLLSEIRKKYPENIKKYCEPFVGGGAVLLDILANFQPEEVLINDINPQLTNLYIQIRDNAEYLIKNLSELQKKYWAMNEDERKLFYKEQREMFNKGIADNTFSKADMAYLFIFLNKTCFNGLYCVNKGDMMKKYIVTIEERVSEDFEVVAESLEEAVDIAEKNYYNGEFVLEPGNLVCKQISADGGNGDCCEWHEF